MRDKSRQDPETDEFIDLRSRAEAAMQEKAVDPPDASTLPTKELQALVHELQVHQIELEMQNKELKRVQLELEKTKDNYQDLYDFAPVGYFILTAKGLIIQANLTGAALLANSRPKLIRMRFGHFVAPESEDRWYQHIISVLKQEEKTACDLTLTRKDGSSFYAHLESIRIETPTEQQEANSGTHEILMAVTDITDRKRVEAQLRESEARYRIVADFTYDWEYWVNAEGNLFYVSPSCERITGYSVEEFINDSDLMNRIIHPDDRKEMLEHYHEVRKITPRAVETRDFRIIRRDGETRWIGHVCQPVYDQEGQTLGRRASNRDITERKRAEEAHKLLSTAIEQAAEGVIITDTNGTIQYVNPAEEILSGYSRDELIGQAANIFKSDKHSEDFFTNMWETIKSGKVCSGRFINRKKDGSEYREDNSVSPVYNKSGKLTNFVAVKHDVTKQIELQEQLFQAQKMEAIGTLAGGFAHDFKNKLQVIEGYVDLILLNKDLPTIVESDLEIIKQTLDGSAELIKGMMVFSRRTSVKLGLLNLNKLVENLRSMLTPVMPKMIGVDLVLADDLWRVNASPSHIEQVLMNLAINAKDVMPDGGRLTIRTQNIVIDEDFCQFDPIAKPGRYALVTLSDTGTGMDKETVSHIFEPFFTTKEPGKGTGLGLAVVYGIVEQHGGRITCYSEPSVGTTFRIYFPAIGEVPEDQYSQEIEPPQGHGETILLVDDDSHILEVASSLLARAYYRVITASTGEDASRIYVEHREDIRLVILDVIMPGMGGEECLRNLLKIDPDVKVLMASGALKPGMVKDLKTTGARDFTGKPFDMPQLLQKIRKIIDEE